MPIDKDSACIATPGFSGFIPTMRYQFGMTYGNASRKLAHYEDDQSGKHLHGIHIRHHEQGKKEEGSMWNEKRGVVSSVDDRFSFPPVPGYTVS
jgi:hypothetical protein